MSYGEHMKIAVVTPIMQTGEQGGAEALYDGLVGSLQRASYDVDQIEVIKPNLDIPDMMQKIFARGGRPEVTKE